MLALSKQLFTSVLFFLQLLSAEKELYNNDQKLAGNCKRSEEND